MLREHPDKPTPVVVDMWDQDSHLYREWGYARQRYYESEAVGAEVVDLDLPEDL